MNRYLRCYAEISLEAIGHNIREVKKRLPEGVKLLGVVKANAYGHGAVPVASYLENQVDYFATATIEEAFLSKGWYSGRIVHKQNEQICV